MSTAGLSEGEEGWPAKGQRAEQRGKEQRSKETAAEGYSGTLEAGIPEEQGALPSTALKSWWRMFVLC